MRCWTKETKGKQKQPQNNIPERSSIIAGSVFCFTLIFKTLFGCVVDSRSKMCNSWNQ